MSDPSTPSAAMAGRTGAWGRVPPDGVAAAGVDAAGAASGPTPGPVDGPVTGAGSGTGAGAGIRIGRILRGIGFFIGIWLLLEFLPDETGESLVPIILVAAFAWTAVKAPPIAIGLLLYVAMVRGGWFILAAAPVTLILARRHQRMRMGLPAGHEHLRRTALLAALGLLATLPFIDTAFGPWSDRASSSGARSADPLFEEGGDGDSVLERLARWLRFGPDGDTPGQPVELIPVQPKPPDDPFNWWPLVFALAIVALVTLLWWLWQRSRRSGPARSAVAAAGPLARLEALGSLVGRPRRPAEGAITYGRALAAQTGDARLAEAGPLVSGEVYQSAFADPRRVDENLRGIETTPPATPPAPPLRDRLSDRLGRFRVQAGVLFASLAAVALVIIIVFVIVPRLGAL